MLSHKQEIYVAMVGALANVYSNSQWDQRLGDQKAADAARLTDAYYEARKQAKSMEPSNLRDICAQEVLANLVLKSGEVTMTEAECKKLAEKAFSIADFAAAAFAKNNLATV